MEKESPINSHSYQHEPVLAEELGAAIATLPIDLLHDGLGIDATVGGGGHCSMLLKAHPQLRFIAIDQDPSAREAAKQRLKCFKNRVKIVASNFGNFIPLEKAIFVIADLGVSSPQLDVPERGFSFRLNGSLDMRMNPDKGETAAELIDKLQENELAEIIYKYGEEKFSRRIARRIKKDLTEVGSYSGTSDLAYSIAGCYPPKMRHGRIHPATRTFQALRIAVNNEMTMLDQFLENSPDWLRVGGLIGIISFHSLEDRKVKLSFKNDNRLSMITRKPIIPSPNELLANPRSRSAKLRLAIRK